GFSCNYSTVRCVADILGGIRFEWTHFPDASIIQHGMMIPDEVNLYNN
ncbi:MAG: hypothetical protein JWN30_2872, partial [Bacilli bacterium]|nr:hypothetical protein [Bacilli bacterium]